ncbi:21159_t:CDS:2, partial [Gigaspora margarita]
GIDPNIQIEKEETPIQQIEVDSQYVTNKDIREIMETDKEEIK